MLLFENSVLKLNYSPASDVLEVVYPDLHDYLLPEIKHSINILLDTVRNYDIKRVLLDSTRTVISVGAEESKEISLYLASGFMNTRVQKIARLQSMSAAVETSAQHNMQHLQKTNVLPFLLENFTSRDAAMEWLKG